MKIWTVPVCHLNIRKKEINVIHGNQLKQKENTEGAIKNGQYKIGICCFSVNQTALRRKSKDWLAWNQNNVSLWSDMSTREQ
jgi:hypothetical protein